MFLLFYMYMYLNCCDEPLVKHTQTLLNNMNINVLQSFKQLEVGCLGYASPGNVLTLDSLRLLLVVMGPLKDCSRDVVAC